MHVCVSVKTDPFSYSYYLQRDAEVALTETSGEAQAQHPKAIKIVFRAGDITNHSPQLATDYV